MIFFRVYVFNTVTKLISNDLIHVYKTNLEEK